MASFDPNTWYQIYNASSGASQVITLGGTGKPDSYAVLLMPLPISPIENTHWQILELSDGSFGFVNRWLANHTGLSTMYNAFTTETLTQDGPAVDVIRNTDFSGWPAVARWQITQDSQISGNKWYMSNMARGAALYLYVNQNAGGFLRLNQFSSPQSNCVWGFSSAAPILGTQVHLATSAIAVQSSSTASSVFVPSSTASSSSTISTSSLTSMSNSTISIFSSTTYPSSTQVMSQSTSQSTIPTETAAGATNTGAESSVNNTAKVAIAVAIICAACLIGVLGWLLVAKRRKYKRHLANCDSHRHDQYRKMASEMSSVSVTRQELPSQSFYARQVGNGKQELA